MSLDVILRKLDNARHNAVQKYQDFETASFCRETTDAIKKLQAENNRLKQEREVLIETIVEDSLCDTQSKVFWRWRARTYATRQDCRQAIETWLANRLKEEARAQ